MRCKAVQVFLGLVLRVRLPLALLLWCAAQAVSAEVTTVLFRGQNNTWSHKDDYANALLHLALSKVDPSLNSYRLEPSPPMTKARAVIELKAGTLRNFVLTMAGPTSPEQLRRVDIPIFLGFSDYRVCFVRDAVAKAVAAARSPADLAAFSFGHGLGWRDTPILRANGLTVLEVTNHSAILSMMQMGRIDLFCRNLIEAHSESRALPEGVRIEPSLMLRYASPHYFVTHVRDAALAEQIQRGLALALKDGSAQELLRRYTQPAVQALKPGTRRIITLHGDDAYDHSGLPKLEFLGLDRGLRP